MVIYDRCKGTLLRTNVDGEVAIEAEAMGEMIVPFVCLRFQFDGDRFGEVIGIIGAYSLQKTPDGNTSSGFLCSVQRSSDVYFRKEIEPGVTVNLIHWVWASCGIRGCGNR